MPDPMPDSLDERLDTIARQAGLDNIGRPPPGEEGGRRGHGLLDHSRADEAAADQDAGDEDEDDFDEDDSDELDDASTFEPSSWSWLNDAARSARPSSIRLSMAVSSARTPPMNAVVRRSDSTSLRSSLHRAMASRTGVGPNRAAWA